MKKLCCLVSILAAALTGCATAPALDAQGNYVSPNHTFSVNVPANMHTINASSNSSMEYVDFGSGTMSRGYELFEGGIQGIEWIPATSAMIPGVYMHSKHSAAEIFNQYERYLQADNHFTNLVAKRTMVKTVNGHTAYEIEGTAKEGTADIKFISTAIIMPQATANITSVLSVTGAVFTGKEFAAHYQKLVAAHQHVVRTIRPL